jgi:hypothetical protein
VCFQDASDDDEDMDEEQDDKETAETKMMKRWDPGLGRKKGGSYDVHCLVRLRLYSHRYMFFRRLRASEASGKRPLHEILQSEDAGRMGGWHLGLIRKEV